MRTSTDAGWLERRFDFAVRGTNLRTELVAGVTTFVVMAYIIFVNPAILSGGPLAGVGPPHTATLTVTCLAAGLLSIAMGLATNYPFALAPGLGLNAVVAFQLILGEGLPWQAAMGVIFLEGLLITLLVLTGFRQAVMDAIPLSQKRAISVGIGLFILFIGLNNAGLVRPGEGTPMSLGDLTSFPALLAILALGVTALLAARRVRAALIAGIVLTTMFGIAAHYIVGVDISSAPGVQGPVPTSIERPDFSTVGAGVNFDVFHLAGYLTAVLVIFTLMLSDFFDTMGTVIGVGEQAGFVDERGRLPGAGRVLLVDSLGATVGGAFSASSVTTYVESAAGVAEGGRTGLVSVVVGILFLASMLVAPFATMVPSEATAAALIVVGFLMAGVIRDIDFGDFEEGFPALITMTMMPFTYNITNGIGAGFLMYVFLKAARGRVGEVHPLLWFTAGAFLVYFLVPLIEARFVP